MRQYYSSLLNKIYFFSDIYKSSKWKDYSKLIIKSDGYNWVYNSIKEEFKKIFFELDIEVVEDRFYKRSQNQCLFSLSKYDILMNWQEPFHKTAFSYFHGDPDQDKQSALMLSNLSKYHSQIDRIHVSNSFTEKIILKTGILKNKVFKIPISIDINLFNPVNIQKKVLFRKKNNIPGDCFLIGSFQKDGDGWGKGMVPKLIKGPDIFIKSISLLKDKIPNLHVLLTGPSRGYVIKKLKEINIPYTHILLKNYKDIGKFYNMLDLYIVSSRIEGGPRAVLESMASGIPIISTKVGQSVDLIINKENGFLVDIEDFESINKLAFNIYKKNIDINDIIKKARQTSENNCYYSQIKLWENFMIGFIK